MAKNDLLLQKIKIAFVVFG